MSNKLATLLGAVAITGVTAGMVMAADFDPDTVRDGKVPVCHFGGHDGDFVITGRGGGCHNQEGNIIVISCNALKGHRIEQSEAEAAGFCG